MTQCATTTEIPNYSGMTKERFYQRIAHIPTLVLSVRAKECSICSYVDQALEVLKDEAKVNIGVLYVHKSRKFVTEYGKYLFKEAGMYPKKHAPLFFEFRFGIGNSYAGPREWKLMREYYKERIPVLKLTKDMKDVILNDLWNAKVIVNTEDYKLLHQLAHVFRREIPIVHGGEMTSELSLKKDEYILKEPFEDDVRGPIKENLHEMIDLVQNTLKRNIQSVSGENVLKLFKKHRWCAVAFTKGLDVDQSKIFLNAFHEASLLNPTETKFLYTTTEKMGEYLLKIGIPATDAPILIMLNTKTSEQKIFPKEKNILSPEEILEFIGSIFHAENKKEEL